MNNKLLLALSMSLALSSAAVYSLPKKTPLITREEALQHISFMETFTAFPHEVQTIVRYILEYVAQLSDEALFKLESALQILSPLINRIDPQGNIFNYLANAMHTAIVSAAGEPKKVIELFRYQLNIMIRDAKHHIESIAQQNAPASEITQETSSFLGKMKSGVRSVAESVKSATENVTENVKSIFVRS